MKSNGENSICFANMDVLDLNAHEFTQNTENITRSRLQDRKPQDSMQHIPT